MCNALLLLIPGLAFIEPDVFVNGPSVPVKEVTEMLSTASGYAPSNISNVPFAT